MSIKISSQLEPTSQQAKYPTHSEEYAKGGWRSVATIEERNAISIRRRKLGMAVFCLEDLKTYTLLTGLENEFWEIHPSSIRGESAYEIAKKYDNTIGTEEEWVKSLSPEISVGDVSIASGNTPKITIDQDKNKVKFNFELPSISSASVVTVINTILSTLNENSFLNLLFEGNISGNVINVEGVNPTDKLLVIYNGLTLMKNADYVVTGNKITLQLFENMSDYEVSNFYVFKFVKFNFEQFS